ncbi:MAG: alpha-xylosidase [Christensenellales bacterium]
MKFNCGEWMMKPGVISHNCEQVREVELNESKTKLWLYGVTYQEDRRSLDGPAIELEVTSPQPDIIRLRAVHFKGDTKKYAKFDLFDAKCELDVEDTIEKTVVRSGKTMLVIEKRPSNFTWYYNGRMLTGIGAQFGKRMLSFVSTPRGPFMRAQLDLDIGEHVFGLGERFTPFVRNGQVVDIWNEDGGTSSEISYKNIPFYITDRGYGVFVNDTGNVSYEICTEQVERVQFSVPGHALDFMIIGADDMKGALKTYTALTGRPALPPAWSFGLWLSSSFTTSYDEKTVLSLIDGMLKRDIPLSVFHFDCFWMRENEWCGFVWDEKMFPNVEGLLKKIHDRGVKVCVWINPYIAQKSKVFGEAKDKGYLLKRSDGTVWQWDLWQSGLAVYDFTNPAAVDWYKEKLKGLLRQGVDAFKTDFGERIPVDCVYFDGSEQYSMHNYYSYIYNKIVYEAIAEERGEKEACLFARSATAGGQRFPVHWGGDCNSTYQAMSESLRAGLSLCLSGFGFWSHDIGGFEGTAPSHVYKRWLAFGLLSTHSRLHGSESYRIPWLFGEEAAEVCRFFTKLKCELMPYIYGLASEAAKTGLTAMRAMALEFDELGAVACDKQYMLGDSLLVAPVLRENGSVDVFLPRGIWTNFFTGELVYGDGWRTETHDFFSLPLYIRQNSIIPLGRTNTAAVYAYDRQLDIVVYALCDGAFASREIVDVNGAVSFIVNAERKQDEIEIRLSMPPDGLKIIFAGNKLIKAVSGAKAIDDNRGAAFYAEDIFMRFVIFKEAV